MAWTLLAANDLWQNLIIPIGVFIFWVVVNVFKGMTEAPNPPKKLNRPGRPENGGRRQDPQKELEKFLEELGLKTKPQTTPNAAPNRPEKRVETPRKPKQPGLPSAARQSDAAANKKEAVRRRHLKSDLERRHAESLPSRVENQHLVTHVGSSSLSSLESVPVEIVVEAPTTPRTPRQNSLAALLGDQGTLSQAFILGTILGPPPGLRD